MVFTSTDGMTVSLTINGCVFVFSCVPKLRRLITERSFFRRFPRLRKTCRCFESRPLRLAKIVTEQLLVWILVLLSLVAMCSTDVIKYPFRSHEQTTVTAQLFLRIIFGINVGKYIFMLVQLFFLIHSIPRLQFRAELVHHSVTMVCYSLFLAYRQNTLLGLIGVMMEVNTVFDEVGKHMKESGKHRSVRYRRLVMMSCVAALGMRGIVPVTFLVIAMFHQTPFAMDYAPLTFFFLSIIFFSVINVWLVLTNIQRLIKVYCHKNEGEGDYDRRERSLSVTRTTGSHMLNMRGINDNNRGIQLSKNNLGYLRPYENKNIANHSDDSEKLNLNNRKEFAKETLELQISADVLVAKDNDEAAVATLGNCAGAGVPETGAESRLSGRVVESVMRDSRSPDHDALRASDSSASTNSESLLICSNMRQFRLPPTATLEREDYVVRHHFRRNSYSPPSSTEFRDGSDSPPTAIDFRDTSQTESL